MGEEVFTPEEKVILGEDTEPQPAAQEKPPVTDGAKPDEGGKPLVDASKPAETKEPEHTEEEQQAAEKEGFRIEGKFLIDSEGTKIPLQKWRKHYYDGKQAEREKADATRKLRLFQVLGPEKYYGIYPDEKPADFKPAEAAAKPKQAVDPLDLVATYPAPNHPFHGKTLREIYKEDAAEGRRLERGWEQGQREQEISERRQRETETETQQRILKESESEINDFSGYLSKEFFNKEFSALTEAEAARISETIQKTLDFMMTTRRGSGLLADAYFIMNRDTILTDARTKGGQAAVEALKKSSIPSINASGGAATTTMDSYEAMSPDQLAKAIEGMNDKQYASFIKNASATLKAKNPGLPWD